MTAIARRAAGQVADPFRAPDRSGAPASQPSESACDDLMREKVRLVRTVAEGVLAAPQDRRLDEAQDALLVAQAMEQQAERLRRELSRTLKPWAEDAAATSLYRHNTFVRGDAAFRVGAPPDPRTLTAKVFRRYAVGSDNVYFEIHGWPANPNTELKACWEFRHGFGSFQHSDLTTVQAISDLMCRQHGYMMTDDPSDRPGDVSAVLVKSPRPTAPQLAPAASKEVEAPEPEAADQEQPEMIWDPVFG